MSSLPKRIHHQHCNVYLNVQVDGGWRALFGGGGGERETHL